MPEKENIMNVMKKIWSWIKDLVTVPEGISDMI
jgi:hypothetical protein